jgi:hypothetical protein
MVFDGKLERFWPSGSYLDFHERSGFDTTLESSLHDVGLDRKLK